MCNGVYDCPGREDEEKCDSYACPGFYRCRGSTVCVHPSHVCDGMLQCPQRDDELFCNLTCPPGCTCLGLAFTCSRSFQAGLHPRLRYLHVSGDEAMTPALLKDNVILVYLSLARCGLTSADDLRFPNLHTLDLSDNRIREISFDQLSFLVNLKSLYLSGNPVTALFSDGPSGQSPIPQLLKLDLSRVDLEVLNVSALDPLNKLRTLNLSHSGVSRVLTAEGKVRGRDPAHVALTSLRVLDVRGCPMTQFPTDLFRSLKDLSDVYADTYRLCCPDLLPPAFDVNRCRATSDSISSCRSLLASDTPRVLVSVSAAFALTGNFANLFVRVYLSRTRSASRYHVYLSHLACSDFLMGVYLAMLACADTLYRGRYLREDIAWRHSAACQMAGFISLLSRQTSACVVCLMTLDNGLTLYSFLVPRLRDAKSAHLVCAVVWGLGFLLASIPLMTSQWEWHSQSAICQPMPGLAGVQSAGSQYALGAVVFNLALSALGLTAQAAVFALLASRTSASSKEMTHDVRMARRLGTMVTADVTCWIAADVTALMALHGVHVPDGVGVAMATVVASLHSAVNPLLYAHGATEERRCAARRERVMKYMTAKSRNSDKGRPLQVAATVDTTLSTHS